MPIPGEPGVHQQEARETSDRTGHPISPRSCATSAWGTERPAGHWTWPGVGNSAAWMRCLSCRREL